MKTYDTGVIKISKMKGILDDEERVKEELDIDKVIPPDHLRSIDKDPSLK